MTALVPPPRRIAFVGILALLAVAPAVRAADDDKVTVSVVAILATDQNAKVDKKLTAIAAELQKLDPTLTGFQSAKETRKEIGINVSEKFDLVENQTVTITVEQAANKENKNRLRISPPTLNDITYCTTCGKFLPIITEYKTKNGEVLILAIRVQPCREK